MKKLVKYSALLALTFAAVGTLAACSASNSKSESGKSDEKKVTVEIATVGTTRPFSYDDEDGKLTGYEIEVLREVFKGSDKYEINFNKLVPTILVIQKNVLVNIFMEIHMLKTQRF